MNLSPPARPRRRPSLTPMIDVVFLLLVFFMLASRFGLDAVIPLPLAGGGGGYEGAPRLVEIRPETLALNGQPMAAAALPGALEGLTATPADTIILRGRDDADLQRVIGVAETLRAAGFQRLVLIE
ncbi:ExbD/TolR family protein [Pseudooceanicola aestuarii]|uniref:ExbD/TolR family protein n=1 Tax=Pseudooceanicola aestuarii TaxID=2697319 RepID=UPI0013D73F40|nr:biopolymer transporter ExbD [Pseudooceanicola aestuarii]